MKRTPLPTTPRVAVLLKLAEKISREMGCNYVGTEHILLALFRIKDGLGHDMLMGSGASKRKAKSILKKWAKGIP